MFPLYLTLYQEPLSSKISTLWLLPITVNLDEVEESLDECSHNPPLAFTWADLNEASLVFDWTRWTVLFYSTVLLCDVTGLVRNSLEHQPIFPLWSTLNQEPLSSKTLTFDPLFIMLILEEA